MLYLCTRKIAQWCNGSIPDSGSDSSGSSPDWATGYKSQAFRSQTLAIFVLANRTTVAPRISANGFNRKKYDEKKPATIVADF